MLSPLLLLSLLKIFHKSCILLWAHGLLIHRALHIARRKYNGCTKKECLHEACQPTLIHHLRRPPCHTSEGVVLVDLGRFRVLGTYERCMDGPRSSRGEKQYFGYIVVSRCGGPAAVGALLFLRVRCFAIGNRRSADAFRS